MSDDLVPVKCLITDEQIENWFTYHSPTPEQSIAYSLIRAAAKNLAEVIVANCPNAADTTAAIRKVREAAMTANQAIGCGGK